MTEQIPNELTLADHCDILKTVGLTEIEADIVAMCIKVDKYVASNPLAHASMSGHQLRKSANEMVDAILAIKTNRDIFNESQKRQKSSVSKESCDDTNNDCCQHDNGTNRTEKTCDQPEDTCCGKPDSCEQEKVSEAT